MSIAESLEESVAGSLFSSACNALDCLSKKLEEEKAFG